MKQFKMKKIFLLLLLIPALAISQQEEGKKPLTPYADIAFTEGVVLYTLAQNQAMLNPRLLPKVYDKKLLRLRFSNNFNSVSGKYFAVSQVAIRDYVDTELILLRSASEQMDYLKLCTLLVIWDKTLSKHAQTELGKILISSKRELRGNTKLVIDLHEFYSNQ